MACMKRNNTRRQDKRRAVFAFALVFACVWNSFPHTAALSLDGQGYLFLHPFFKSREWKASLNSLDLVMPDDSLAKYRPQGFDVSQGGDSAVAVFSANGTALFCMPVWYESLAAPCLDDALTFDTPRPVALGRLAMANPRAFYVVKDSLYSYDSIRVVVPSAVTPLMFYVAGINLGGPAVTELDSITLAPSRAGQRILGVFGDPDSIALQDRGIWVTGTLGLLRYIPYVNRQWGAVLQRDLADTSTVLHTNGVYAGTMEGRLYRKNAAGTAFLQEGASAGKSVWRVYQQGVIGDDGLFKENENGVWKRDTAFGPFAFRYANFIRRPGGFGVELLDSNWAYTAYTYRDTSTIIQSTVPASLMTSVNATPYVFPRTGTVNVTVNLDDLDSNYSDYRLWLNGTTDLKNDGTYTISLAAIADTETCHIGVLKMTSGSVRLTLADDTVKIAHDCAIGALNPTCLSCYWKKYAFARSVKWVKGDSVTLSTASQTLRITNGNGQVTTIVKGNKNADESMFHARFANRNFEIEFPLKNGAPISGVAIHDLKGRLLASSAVMGQRIITIPAICPAGGVVIISCRLSDGSVTSRKMPLVR